MNNQNNQLNPDAQFQPYTTQPMGSVQDEIDLRELFSVIWKGKWIIIAITFVFAVASVAFAINQPNIYQSEALLSPADSEQAGGGLAALAGQFGGLASMAGINLGSGAGADKSQMAIEVMLSRKFLGDFIQEHDILVDLMAADNWNMLENTLSYDNDVYDISKGEWIREVKPPFKPKPSLQEAYKQFTKNLSVSKDKETGMITVSIFHYSPYVAQKWTEWLIKDINKVMKNRDVAEAIRSTEFLNKQIQQTNVADIRTVLYKLIEEQAKTIMFAEVRDEYVFKTIDPAIVAEVKAKPNRLLTVLIGTFLGFFLSLFFILSKLLFKRIS
ncbi:Wzz/FepE/Etk N-terminal domain-containing protein [Shewanella sp.]|uniref:Wzz/FepE/Etk N-terminal domain-containing protein n=1 Tax=Shewanella sp. TaxID=50422 RepID=UPI0040479E64